MMLKGKTIGSLVGPQYEDLEFWVPHMRVQEEGADTVIIGARKGVEYRSKSGGLTVVSDISAREVAAVDLHAVLIPGGWAPDKLRRDEDVLGLVRQMHAQKKIIGMICHAGWVAVSARICHGRRATGSLGIKDDMENAGAIWVDEPAFREDNLVWGRVVADIPNYCYELIKALSAELVPPA